MTPAVFIGYDHREVDAYRACVESLTAHARGRFTVHPVSYLFLGTLYRRPVVRTERGFWDPISKAPMSTEFSLARFWVPFLKQSGPALYCDGDFMFRAPIEELFELFDERYAVQVVKHEYTPVEASKMDGQLQTAYPRKNWSSLMLFNSDMVLGATADEEFLTMLNSANGLGLHQLHWLPDTLIGALPAEWNWLAGVNPPNPNPKAVHYTLGIPRMRGYENAPFAEEWHDHARRHAPTSH